MNCCTQYIETGAEEHMRKLIFFTDITTDVSNYCLLNVKKYNDTRKEKKKVVLIDPGVHELAKMPEYSKIEFLHKLAGGALRENEFISIDYPSDMNPKFQDQFIEKTIQNNIKYRDNPQYIATVQYKLHDPRDFEFRLKQLLEFVDPRKKIIGFGNLCRIIHPNRYTDLVFKIIRETVPFGTRLHFYGLSLKVIKKYLPRIASKYIISVDSTKWTRAVNDTLKKTYGVACRKDNRDIFFLAYINELKKYFDEIIF